MSIATTTITASTGFFAAVARGYAAFIASRSRMPEIERLLAKSDADLAALGITRDEIPRYVFRDLMYL